MERNTTVGKSKNHLGACSLVDLCRDAIIENLERYPPQAFAIIDDFEWDNIVKSKHEKSKPQKGSGGLDGTGRMNPAISEAFLSQTESELPHLATSSVSDTLIWKDIVNHKFRKNGLSRPTNLCFPYPILEARLQKSGELLTEFRKKKTVTEQDKRLVVKAIKVIGESPMDVTLLKSSGIGKSVQKFINFCGKSIDLDGAPIAKLTTVLESWKQMASTSGVVMKDKNRASKPGRLTGESLDLARQCNSWRQLFIVLKQSDKARRENQGARMRERRDRLNSERPKIVKVRPKSSSRQDGMLQRNHSRSQKGYVPLQKQSKMQRLKTEARITTARRSAPPKPNDNFGAAVAFATGSSHKRKKGTGTTAVDLGGGKRMRLPNARPRAFFKKKGTNFL